jgi:hypothetical protein
MHSEIWKEVSICCSGFIIHDADCLTGCKVAGFSATEQTPFPSGIVDGTEKGGENGTVRADDM